MKKILLAVALISFLASCKKDYTCTCTITDLDPDDGISFSGSIDYSLGKQKKSDAEKACDVYTETDAFSSTVCESTAD